MARLSTFCVLLSLLTVPVRAQDARATTVADSLMARFDRDDGPGGVVAVVRDGEVTAVRAYGVANLAYDLPNTPETVFNIGSASKQFAAVFYAMQAGEGVLSLDDDVRTYVPELPDFGPTVRLRHLLTHTSGYREAYGPLALTGRSTAGDLLRRDDALDVVRRQTALQFEPGSRFLYNSTAYVILTEIAERISGQPYPAWMAEHVFGPLGMTHTTVEREQGQAIPNAAVSYTAMADGHGYREDVHGYNYYGATDVHTTVGDLARWMRALRDGELGTGVFERMTERSLALGGDTLSYALGLVVDAHGGQRRIQHSGATGGYRAFFSYYPALDAGVVVLANTAEVAVVAVGEAVAAAAFQLDLAPPPSPAGVAVAPDVLARYAGSYWVPGRAVYRMEVQSGALAVGPSFAPTLTPLTALDDSTFATSGGGRLHLSPSGGRAVWTDEGDTEIVRLRPTPEVVTLGDYVGRYFSDEVETFYTVAAEAGGLTMTHRRVGTFSLQAIAEDTFVADPFGWGVPATVLRFRRDASGRVAGFWVSSGRMIDVPFERIR